MKINLLKEIEEYCELNEIESVEGFINRMIATGFTIEKYGFQPTVKYVSEDKPIEVVEEVIKIERKDLYNE